MPLKLKKEKKNWYVLTTRPKAEKQISKRLTQDNIENYLPLHRQLRIWHDRKKWVEMPLFSCYIFVYIEDKYRSKVFDIGGIVKYVSIAGEVSVLKANEIERIKKICSYLGEIEIEKDRMNIGDEVEVIHGHFSGIRGHVFSVGENYKFRISIPILGSAAMIPVDKDNIRKIV